MQVFIDEVGDHGVQFDKQSSTHFTVAMVIFRDDEKAYLYRNHIENLKKKLCFSERGEFHFKENATVIKEQFVNLFQHFDFEYYIFIIDKIVCSEL
jgi:hypothetical protein